MKKSESESETNIHRFDELPRAHLPMSDVYVNFFRARLKRIKKPSKPNSPGRPDARPGPLLCTCDRQHAAHHCGVAAHRLLRWK
jgi:hypothetical protein